MELATNMSKHQGIFCIGVSYTPPYFYLAGFRFARSSQCLFLHKTLSLDTKNYPSAIWTASLPYASFNFNETIANEVDKNHSLKFKKQIQYVGLKHGIHCWQSCEIQAEVFYEHLNVFGQSTARMHVLELDVLAIWEYAFIKTCQPFNIRLVLWPKDRYLIGILGRESMLWQVWYWPIDVNWWQALQASAKVMPALISYLGHADMDAAIAGESIMMEHDLAYAVPIALAYRGIRHAL